MTATSPALIAYRGPNVDAMLAAVVVFLLPLTYLGRGQVTAGLLFSVFLVPVTFRAVGRHRGGYLLVAVTLAAAACAPLLSWSAVLDNSTRSIDRQAEIRLVLLLAGSGLVLMTLLWAREQISLRAIALLFGSGALVQAVLTPSAYKGDAWKYALAWPVAVILLAAVANARSRLTTVLALAALAAISIRYDFRSFAALAVVAGCLFVWRSTRRARPGRRAGVGLLVAAVAVGAVVYQAGTYLAEHGQLGESIQLRTLQQTSTGSSLILGGRPESQAAIRLFKERPIGFGPGIRPTMGDVELAKSGLYAVNAATTGGYVDDYLFADRLELHSVASDLWVNFGLLGLFLAGLMAWLLVAALGRDVTGPRMSGLLILVCLVGLWDLAFSPIGADVRQVTFALALTLPLRSGTEQGDDSESDHDRERTGAHSKEEVVHTG